uniref:Uncharacterized protein n=1 Tax=Eutreptiella gymnastica TaxID=73025 RepID=A0A7S4G002_9EUGL
MISSSDKTRQAVLTRRRGPWATAHGTGAPVKQANGGEKRHFSPPPPWGMRVRRGNGDTDRYDDLKRGSGGRHVPLRTGPVPFGWRRDGRRSEDSARQCSPCRRTLPNGWRGAPQALPPCYATTTTSHRRPEHRRGRGRRTDEAAEEQPPLIR